MCNVKMTNLKIGFALDGYENDILSWLNIVIQFFNNANYPLKSVSYDIDYNKYYRKSLKKFYETLENDKTLPVEKLYSFTVFAGEKQNIPSTWYYGCWYDKPTKQIILFFDSIYEENKVLSFYKDFFQILLKDHVVQGGYLFYQDRHDDYPLGGVKINQNFYNEDEHAWWVLMKPKNREETLKKRNMYRHIYKQNILSKYHLEEKFDGVILSKWIDKNNYGNIEKIGIENWLWTVPEEKLHGLQVVFYDKHLLLGVKYE